MNRVILKTNRWVFVFAVVITACAAVPLALAEDNAAADIIQQYDLGITVAPHDGSTDWVRDTTEVQAPAGAAGVQIWCQIIAAGRAWFDGLTWQEKGAGGGFPPWAIGAVVGVLVLAGLGVLLLRRRRA